MPSTIKLFNARVPVGRRQNIQGRWSTDSEHGKEELVWALSKRDARKFVAASWRVDEDAVVIRSGRLIINFDTVRKPRRVPVFFSIGGNYEQTTYYG